MSNVVVVLLSVRKKKEIIILELNKMKYLENFDYEDVDAGIQNLKTNNWDSLPRYTDESIIFHVYWYGRITRKQILCINSYLYSQDLNHSKLYVWLDYLTWENSDRHLIPKHQNIEIKKYIPRELAIETNWENKNFINFRSYLKFRSDTARLLFLYQYGGLYFDLDMVLLKDLKPVLGIEFCYAWSNLKRGNNGMLRLFQKSKNTKIIMDKYYEEIPKTIETNQLIFTDDLNIYCLPCVIFDPVWILFDTKSKSKFSELSNFDDFFKETKEDINDFFDNQILAYHWHSRNENHIEKNSYFEKLELKF